MAATPAMRIRPAPPPPPPEPAKRAKSEMARRARVALRILERGQWASDGETYASRANAAGYAKRLIDALVKYEEVPRAHLTRRTFPHKRGFQWRVAFKPDHQPHGIAADE